MLKALQNVTFEIDLVYESFVNLFVESFENLDFLGDFFPLCNMKVFSENFSVFVGERRMCFKVLKDSINIW